MSAKTVARRPNGLYVRILNLAADRMFSSDGLEPRSAIKQAAHDLGVEYGDDMGRAVTAVEAMLLGTIPTGDKP